MQKMTHPLRIFANIGLLRARSERCGSRHARGIQPNRQSQLVGKLFGKPTLQKPVRDRLDHFLAFGLRWRMILKVTTELGAGTIVPHPQAFCGDELGRPSRGRGIATFDRINQAMQVRFRQGVNPG